MRHWSVDVAPPGAEALGVAAALIPALGEAGFGSSLLAGLRGALPVGSMSAYRTGARPDIFFSASLGVPDTTRDCWRAYLSGPVRSDRTLQGGHETVPRPGGLQVCHIVAAEVPPEHRAKVYEAHGVCERVSVVQAEQDGDLFALNFYRHHHQRPLGDAQLGDFGQLGGLLMALARKHIALARPVRMEEGAALDAPSTAQRLLALRPTLTSRELEVCARLLQGMTQEGIAVDLGLRLPTVKTYRDRAFGRLGIHFRSELFALVLGTARAR